MALDKRKTGVLEKLALYGKDTEKKLNKDYFVRCNRCFLVNLRFVASVKEDTVFIGQDALQISRSQKKAFLNALTVYIGGVKG